jgi:hypothetical protein
MVRRQLQENVAYLQSAMGATRAGVPMLPMIPLGVDCDAFRRDPALGAAYRQELGIGAEDIAIILVARLSNATSSRRCRCSLPSKRQLSGAGGSCICC